MTRYVCIREKKKPKNIVMFQFENNDNQLVTFLKMMKTVKTLEVIYTPHPIVKQEKQK